MRERGRGHKNYECVFEKTIGNGSEIRYHTSINSEGCEWVGGSSRSIR